MEKLAASANSCGDVGAHLLYCPLQKKAKLAKLARSTCSARSLNLLRVCAALALLQFACASQKSNEDISLEEKAQSWNLVLVVTLLGVCIFCTYLLLTMGTTMRWVRYLPESVVTIILGVMAGSVLTLSGQTLSNLVTFDPQTFFILMLPPIIFESGYSLHKGDFFFNIGSILLFAVLGTLISTLVVGFGAYWIGTTGVSYPLTLLDALTFGSLISATDPVATLAIFHTLDVDPTLYMLVFGESVLNDAVAVVMFRTLLSFYENKHQDYSQALLQFALTSLFSGPLRLYSGAIWREALLRCY